MGLLDYLGLGDTGIGESLGINDENRGAVSRGLLNFAAAVGKPNGGAGLGSSIANGLIGFAQGKQDYEDDQFNKLYKGATIRKARSEANQNDALMKIYQNALARKAGFNPSVPQPQLIAKMPTAWTNSIPSLDGNAGQSSPSEMPVTQPYTPPQPFGQFGSLNPYTQNFTQPTAVNAGATVGQTNTDTGNNATQEKGFGGLPFTYDELALLSMLKPEVAKNMFEMGKYANDGIKRDAGAYYQNPLTGETTYMPSVDKGITFDRKTGAAMAIPGYAAANAAMQGLQTDAQEAAKFPYAAKLKAVDASLTPNKAFDENGIAYPTNNLRVSQGLDRQSGAPFAEVPPQAKANIEGVQDNLKFASKHFYENVYPKSAEAAALAKTFEPTLDRAMEALKRNPNVAGWRAEDRNAFASAAAELLKQQGAKVDTQDFAAIDKALAKSVVQNIASVGGRQPTDADVKFTQKAQAAITDPAESIAFHLAMQKIINRRAVAENNFYNNFAGKFARQNQSDLLQSTFVKNQKPLSQEPELQPFMKRINGK